MRDAHTPICARNDICIVTCFCHWPLSGCGENCQHNITMRSNTTVYRHVDDDVCARATNDNNDYFHFPLFDQMVIR